MGGALRPDFFPQRNTTSDHAAGGRRTPRPQARKIADATKQVAAALKLLRVEVEQLAAAFKAYSNATLLAANPPIAAQNAVIAAGVQNASPP